MPGYISEYDHHGNAPNEFVEVAVPAGTDVSGYSIVIYDSGGFVKATLSLGTVQNTIAGMDVYLVDGSTAGIVSINPREGTALVDDTGTVLQFISHDSNVSAVNGPASGMTSTNIGSAMGTNSMQSDDGGASYYFQTAPNPGIIPCFAPDTMIATPDGLRAVEILQPGDVVATLDDGLQKILWIRHADQPLEGLSSDRRPVLIRAGALGEGRPARDLIVSPQHRILVGGQGQLTGLFKTEVFAPAKALVGLPGIRAMMGRKKITWVQFACARHQVVFADGCATESLLLGPMVIAGLTAAENRALTQVFAVEGTEPEFLNGPPRRLCLKVGQARAMIRKSRRTRVKNRLLSAERNDTPDADHQATGRDVGTAQRCASG